MDPTRRVYFIEGTLDFGMLHGTSIVTPGGRNSTAQKRSPSFARRVRARKVLLAWHRNKIRNHRRRRA